MSVQTEPLSPPPQSTPPVLEQEPHTFTHPWADWFVRVRDKINALNSSLVGLGQVTATGILVRTASGWLTRTIAGVAGRTTVTNGDGVAGNPTIDFDDEAIRDLVASFIQQGTNVTIVHNDATNQLIISSSGGGGGGGSDGYVPDKRSKLYVMQRPETGFGVVTASGTSFTSDAMMIAYRQGSSVTCTHQTDAAGNHARVGTGTTATGLTRLFMFGAGPRINPQAGPCQYSTRIRMPNLSDATQRFQVGVGFTNAITGATRNLSLNYVDNVNSGQWVLTATDSAGTSTVNSAVAPAANTYYNIDILITAGGLSAEAYINDVLVATITTNIPYVDNLGPCNSITKSVGTTERLLDTQYQEFEQDVSR